MKIFLLSLGGDAILIILYFINFASSSSIKNFFSIILIYFLWGLIVGMYGDLERKV
jgi:hypothetical protein